MIKKVAIVLLLLLSQEISAQSVIKKIISSSRPEKWWAITHPFVAPKAFKISNEAVETALAVKENGILDKRWNGGKADAFRHSYWMALLARDIGQRRAWSLGKAHEKGNWITFKKGKFEDGEPPDSISSVMDFFNNNVGINLGLNNCDLTKDQLKELVISEILAGKMKIVKQDDTGQYIDCTGQVINSLKWKGMWGIPKCLVDSNDD